MALGFTIITLTGNHREEPERVVPTQEVTTVCASVYWMNAEAIRSEWDRLVPEDRVPEDEYLKAFSNCDDIEDLDGLTMECDIYAQFPQTVDDDRITSIGHEIMHGFSGDYHQ
jgi:hypothetical protein